MADMLSGSFQVGKISGIPVRIHFSWFIIFGLITWALATQYFPEVAPELPRATNWIRGAAAALMLFLSVTIHELSHSFVARKYNIPIESITLFIFGGVANMKKEPGSPRIELAMALAGPFSSYVLSFLFFIVYSSIGNEQGLKSIASYLFQINFILATFNLIPGFPMDGGRVLRAVLWGRSGDFLDATRKASKAGQGFAIFFVFLGLVSLFTGYVGSVWFLLIGWFLYSAAQTSYLQAAAKGILADDVVRDIMVTDFVAVDADISVSELVDDYFLRYGYGGFPVFEGNSIAGMVSMKEVKEVPRDNRPYTKVRDVMVPFGRSLFVSENEEVSSVFERMGRANMGRFLVVRDGMLVGIITRSGVARFLHLKGELKG